MHTEFRKVTIVKIRKPRHKELNQDLQWFCSTLGLFSMRDKNSSCFRIFIELLKSAKRSEPISSDELGYKLGLTRGTVVHHLNRLIDSGMVIVENNRYFLRVSNLEELVDVIKDDTAKVFENLKEVAKDLDDLLDLDKR
jgi:predicted transcriptional regulator